MHLVGRMRSTALHESWRLVNLLVEDIFHLCSLSNPSTTMQQVVRNRVQEFLKVTTSLVRVHGHMEIFQEPAMPLLIWSKLIWAWTALPIE